MYQMICPVLEVIQAMEGLDASDGAGTGGDLCLGPWPRWTPRGEFAPRAPVQGPEGIVAARRQDRELHVYSSIRAEQIDLVCTRAVGVRDLKAFLDYAERGSIALPARDEGSLGPAESPFEEAVANALSAKGWEVRTQIGVSGFRVDLGVVHPDYAGSYLAGIECDGARYHSSATARDRDKVRQAVLEDLGWTILRVWSTDWFRTPLDVADRLHDKLKQ